VAYPKIELHVHLEGTVRPATLLEIARVNDVALPATTEEGLADLFHFTDFPHFIETWLLVTACLRTADDFRRITVDYAEEAARHGAVYLEGIFAPLQLVRRGVPWEEIYEGFCDGAVEARERHGVEVRLTPDLTRNASPEEMDDTLRYTIAYRDRGIVGVGLGAFELEYPPHLFVEPFRRAREAGLPCVPHAGEVAGPDAIRECLELLRPARLRHGIRAVEDPALVDELARRRIVLDVCLLSNLRVGLVRSLEEHQLLGLVSAGVLCSLSTDDPAMFDTDLEQEYATAQSLGLSPRLFYEAGVAGALCDDVTRARLAAIGDDFDWSRVEAAAVG
jgi:aminodeoxyfutalosine deaminase